MLGEVRAPFKSDEDYNKPIKNKGVFNGNYIIYESNGTDIITDHLLTILMKLGHI